MDAIGLVVRADLRSRRLPLLFLALITAVVVGAVLTAAAGARRTSSVLDRFLESTNASDMMVGLAWPAIADDDELVLQILDELRAFDGVEVARAQSFMPVDAGTDYDFGATTPYGDRVYTDQPIVVAGRLPADDAPNEVAINEIAARELGLGPGDDLEAATMSDEFAARAFESQFEEGFQLDGPHLELDVVGVVREVDDLSPTGSENPQALTSLAFRDRYDDASRFTAMFFLQVDEQEFDRSAAVRMVGEYAPPSAEVFGTLAESAYGETHTAFDAIAVGLALFAIVGLATGAIVIALVLLRHLQLGRADRAGATALGMPNRELAVSAWIPLTVALVPGVMVGSAAAYAASGLFPYSVARRAEVAPGPRFDAAVNLALAAVLLVLLVAAAGLLALVEVRRSKVVGGVPVSRLSSIRRHLTPPVADGCTTVLWGAGRRGTVRPWTAVAGAVIGVAGILAIGVFEASRATATNNPERFGRTWDLDPDLITNDPLGLAADLAADPRVEGVGGVFCTNAEIDTDLTQLCAFYVIGGAISPLVLSGRLPTSPSELALGETTMARVGADIGQRLTITGPDGTAADLTVVGSVVNPDIGDSTGPGEGAILSVDGMESLFGSVWELPYSELIIDLPDGADLETTANALAEDHPIEITPYAFAEPPGQLVQLGRMRPSLVALAIFLGALGAVGLVHYLFLSTRRRRSQTAILRTLGFVRSQVLASTATQAATVAACGIAFGVPLGLIVGRASWLYAVRDIGMDDTPVIPSTMLAIVVIGSIAGSALIAVYPGWSTSRRSPAADLRAE